MNIPGYDLWKLEGLPEIDAIGQLDGETCNRVHEPDEDALRWYRPEPCTGTMHDVGEYGFCACDTCGEVAE